MTFLRGTHDGLGRVRSPRRGVRPALAALVVLIVAAGCGWGSGLGPVADRPVPLVSHSGRWFTDATGRVVMLRGMNFVEKWAPYTPAADGFDDDDAELIASHGFNTVRLGVIPEFLMPTAGVVDRTYLESIASTVRILGRHGIFALLDFHQDGFGPVTHGNGMPAWATMTDGLPNPNAPFPTYYVQNPALQRAFDNFWANKPVADGVPVQTHYATMMRAVAARFVSSPNVIGYEAMNEPWPGTTWNACTTGCPDLEQQLLAPFYARMTAAVRSVDPHRPVFEEPFVLFNFGSTDTVLPGAGSSNALATHVYALDSASNAAVMDRTVAAANRDGVPAIVTEFGDSNDPATLDQFGDQLDARLLPWLYWSYNGHVVGDSKQPLVAPNYNASVLTALTRPYPTLVNGTPTSLTFDTATNTMDLAFTTSRPDGRSAPRGLKSVVVVPKVRYPTGYTVTAVGADITSPRCARTLSLRNQPGATTVSVRITPAANCH
jgi:endoglycosylceramidase